MADVGRIRVCASHTQAAIEARSICTCHPAHLTPQPIEPTGAGAFKGPQCLLGRGKRTSDWRVSLEQNPISLLSPDHGGCSSSGPTTQRAGASPGKSCQDDSSLCCWVCPSNPQGEGCGGPEPAQSHLYSFACMVCPPQFCPHSQILL